MTLRAAWLGFALAAGCAGNGDDLSGDWIGTWSSTVANGTVTESLSQSGDQVEGTAAFTGTSCWNAAQLSLVISGANLSGSALAGEIRADMSATWTADHIVGTFDILTAGTCDGTGTFALDHQ